MTSIWGSLKGSWYLGKGSGALKKGRFDRALQYFSSALPYAEHSGELAILKEAIAETYLRLRQYDTARSYAFESLEAYKDFFSHYGGDRLFKEAVGRVDRLLDEITRTENREGQ